jgi:hypothetical protein
MTKQDIMQVVQNDYFKTGLDPENYRFEYREGRGRFDKIVAVYILQESRSAAAFFEKTTGHIFRAASWSQAAKTRIG